MSNKKIKKVKQNKSKKLTREEKRFYKKHNRYMTAAEKKQALEQKQQRREKLNKVVNTTSGVFMILRVIATIFGCALSLFLIISFVYAIKAIIEGLATWGGG